MPGQPGPVAAPVPPAPVAPRPNLAAPPIPVTALDRGIGDAYGAIVRAGAANPLVAQQASYAYARALQHARDGDVSGALAAAHQAQAEALAGAPVTRVNPLPEPQPPTTVLPPTGANPPANGVPIVANAGALRSARLLVAQNEIDLAEQVTHRSLDDAKRLYRRALDDFQAGNAARSDDEARRAFDAAASALSTAK